MEKESAVEDVLVVGIKKAGGRAYKWISPGNAGVPDRLVVLPHRAPIFVELKTEKGRLSPLQKVQIGKLKDLGQEVRVLYGRAGVLKFLRDEAGIFL